jgi:tetratricopeptide (TPR) repeat protein
MLAEARRLVDGEFRRGRRQLVGRALVHWLGLDRLRRTRIAGVEAPGSAGAAAGAVPRSSEAAGTDGGVNAVAERSANEWLRDGYRRHQSGELAQAAQCYRFVLQLDPDNADANYLLGEIALRQKDFAAAVQWIGRAVSVNPGVAAFHFDLGLALHETGSNERAVASYRKAIELDRADPGTHYYLGVALQAMGRLDEANETFLQALQLKLKRDSGSSPHARGPRREVPRTTLCCIDCRYHDLALAALKRSLTQCRFEQVLFFTDRDFELQGIRVVRIAPIRSLAEYSRFVVKELNRHVETDFALLIQYDGFVLNGRHWSDAFLDYDYIGAKWTFTDGHNVGNGGFSLRSKRLLVALQDPRVRELVPEDLAICRTYRRLLESEHGIRFAPDEVAERFSFEVVQPPGATFGFHGIGHLVRIIDMSETELERYDSGPVLVHVTPEQGRVGPEARRGFGDPKE